MERLGKMMGFREKNITELNFGSLVGEKSIVEGNFTASENTRIDGEVKGNVTCKGKICIGAKGKVTGNIISDGIMIAGNVLGDVTSTGKVEITSTGKITGDIQAKILVIDENAVFNGRCNMTGGKIDTSNTEEKKSE